MSEQRSNRRAGFEQRAKAILSQQCCYEEQVG